MWESGGILKYYEKCFHALAHFFLGCLLKFVEPLVHCVKNRCCFCCGLYFCILLDLLDTTDTLVAEVPGVNVAAVAAEDVIYAPLYASITKLMVEEAGASASILSGVKSISPGLDIMPTTTICWLLVYHGYATVIPIITAILVSYFIVFNIMIIITWVQEPSGFFGFFCALFDGFEQAFFVAFGVALIVAGLVIPGITKRLHNTNRAGESEAHDESTCAYVVKNSIKLMLVLIGIVVLCITESLKNAFAQHLVHHGFEKKLCH